MHHYPRNHQNPCYMDGEKLQSTKKERDVRVLVSSILEPGTQCAKAAQTASTMIRQLTRTRARLTLSFYTSSMFFLTSSSLCRLRTHG